MVSFKAKSGAVVTKSDNKNLKPWRQAVAAAAIAAGVQILDGAVGLEITFYLPRPKGHYGKRGLLPSAPEVPTKYPDSDKVLRAVQDALKGIAYRDDSQVTDPAPHKRYCEEGMPPSTLITVYPFILNENLSKGGA